MPDPEPTRSGWCLQWKRNHSPGGPTGSQHKTTHGPEGLNWGAQQARKVIQDVSNMAPKTENFEDPLEQTSFSACLQVLNRVNTSSSFSKDAGISLSTSRRLPLASSSKPDGNGTLPSQPPPQQMRHNYHLLTNNVSAEIPRNRQLIWKLAKQSEAYLDRLIVLGERALAPAWTC